MPVYPSALSKVQMAFEATAGTDLATTSMVHLEDYEFVEGDAVYRPNSIRGLMINNPGFETVVKRFTNWKISGYFTYEQAQSWFGGIFKVAAPTGLSPYVWTHTQDPTAYPSFWTYTFERREYDGSTAIGQAWHYCVLQKLTLTFAEGQPVKYVAEGFARRVQTETLTTAQTLPTPELIPMALTTLFIDTSWAGLGGTQVASQFLGGSIEITTGAVPIWTGDGRTDLDYTTVGFDASQRGIKANIITYLGGQYATEKTAAEAQSLRAVRLGVAGSGGRAMTIDFLAKYEPGTILNFNDQNGQRIISLPLVSTTDGTNQFKATVTNLVATLV